MAETAANLLFHAALAIDGLVDQLSGDGTHLSGHDTAFLIVSDAAEGYGRMLSWVADVLDDEIAMREKQRARQGAHRAINGGIVAAVSLPRIRELASRCDAGIAALLEHAQSKDAFFVLVVAGNRLSVGGMALQCQCRGPHCRPTLPPSAPFRAP